MAADPSLLPTAKIVIHFQPLDSVRAEYQPDIRSARKDPKYLALLARDYNPSIIRRNFDGLFISENKTENGYIQIFRNGVIEEVEATILYANNDSQKHIVSVYFEGHMINAVMRRLNVLKAMGISPPIVLHLSLLAVKGYKLDIRFKDMNIPNLSSFNRQAAENSIDRDDLLLPGILIEELPSSDNLFQYAASKLHNTFNIIWNAAGLEKSLHYDSEGHWQSRYPTR